MKAHMMIIGRRMIPLVAALVFAATASEAQQQSIKERLVGAGAPAAFADQVATIVATARSEGLPVEPLEAKAVEGWAKHNRVPQQRVVAVLEQLRLRLREAHGIATEAGFAEPPGGIVASAAEALGRSLTPAQVRELIESAPTPDAAAAGLTVAASLAAQGLETAAAVRAVREMHRAGGRPEQIFELPSAVADMLARGMGMRDVASRIMEGGGLPLPGGIGQGHGQGRPDMVPPTRGPVINPPGRQGTRRRRN